MLWPIISAAAAIALPSSGPANTCHQVRDGNTIARVQEEVNRLVPRLRADPTFATAWYEHAPCYRIVFAFTDDRPRPWVTAAASPHLRPYVELRTAKYSFAEREQARMAIMAALELKGLGLAFSVQDKDPLRFVVHVRTDEEKAIAWQAVPDRYKADTLIAVGSFEFRPESSSTGQPAPPLAPGEYAGPSAAEEREMYPRRAMLGAAELQLFVIPFNRQVRNLPGFSDLYIEHEPSWHVVVAFTRPPPLEQVKALAPSVIRDRIVIRTANRTQAQIEADLEAIAGAFRSGGFNFGGGYNPKTQRFGLTVGTDPDRQRAISLIPPGLRSDVDVTVGPLPVPE